MRILDADKMFIGTTGVKRVFQGTDLVWPAVSGITGGTAIHYHIEDPSGNTLNIPLPYKQWWAGSTPHWTNYFETDAGKEEPYYDRNGIMLFENRLINCYRSFQLPMIVGSGETPEWFVDIISLPETLTEMDGAFENNDCLRSINLPSNVQNLRATFWECHWLTGLTIPDGVEELYQTCSRCRRMTYVSIPSSVTYVYYAFSYMDSLTEINFRGTMAQWNAIENVEQIYTSENNLLQRIICTDGTITL